MTTCRCGKMQFTSRADARAYAQKAHKKNSSPRMRVYFCEEADAWHLTTGPKTGRAKGGKRKGKHRDR